MKRQCLFLLVIVFVFTSACKSKLYYLEKIPVTKAPVINKKQLPERGNIYVMGNKDITSDKFVQAVTYLPERVSPSYINTKLASPQLPDKQVRFIKRTTEIGARQESGSENVMAKTPPKKEGGFHLNGVAIASLVLGVLGLFIAPFIFGMLAFFHGLVALIWKPEMNNLSKFIALTGIVLGVINMMMALALL